MMPTVDHGNGSSVVVAKLGQLGVEILRKAKRMSLDVGHP